MLFIRSNATGTGVPFRVQFFALLSVFLLSANVSGEVPPASPTAEQLMRQAHDARAVWDDFPGFSADVSVSTDGVTTTGTITVAKDFSWTLDLPAEPHEEWLQAKLRSVIGHRRPSEMSRAGFTFAEGGGPGRLVANKDGSGTFRIRDGVITEVHRKSSRSWFEISNLELYETAEGRNLPQVSTVVYRNLKSGDIEKHRSNIFEWKWIGTFDLPTRAFTIEVGAGGKRTIREVIFTNLRLNSPTASDE